MEFLRGIVFMVGGITLLSLSLFTVWFAICTVREWLDTQARHRDKLDILYRNVATLMDEVHKLREGGTLQGLSDELMAHANLDIQRFKEIEIQLKDMRWNTDQVRSNAFRALQKIDDHAMEDAKLHSELDDHAMEDAKLHNELANRLDKLEGSRNMQNKSLAIMQEEVENLKARVTQLESSGVEPLHEDALETPPPAGESDQPDSASGYSRAIPRPPVGGYNG
jgi:chromosome segregation ATPase